MLRSFFAAASMLAMSACRPDLPKEPPAQPVVTAVFDPTTAKIPLPNDLAFLMPANTTCPGADPSADQSGPPKCAQAELLTVFNHVFPSDQEVPVTIDFQQTNFNDDGSTTLVAPSLDFNTFTPATLIVKSTSPVVGDVELDPITEADYHTFADHATLTLHRKGRQPWATGSYTVILRGGPDGVQTTDKVGVTSSQVFDLIAQGQNMTDPKNIGLLKAQTGSTEKALAQGAQLNLLIALYQGRVFPFADAVFPHQDMAIAATFTTAPTVTNVTIDPARGLAPLPFDLLRDPMSGKLSALAACTFVGAKLAADGTCPNAAAAGFQALDGFSTTGAILAPTSDLIKASTVTAGTVKLYDLSNPDAPALVDPDSLIIQPCEFGSPACQPDALSPVVAFQPAGATAVDPPGEKPSVFRTKPLKDNTDYAVVITTGVKDKAGNSIGPGTVSKVLRFTNPVSVNGKSALQGIDDATAASLEKMRNQLKPVLAQLPADGVETTDVALAYTFHTQTILSQASQLASLPYNPALPVETLETANVNPLTADQAVNKYAIPVSTTDIDEVIEAEITSFNALDPATGAFLADPSKAAAAPIKVLIATPKSDSVTDLCPGSATIKCAPMMIFRHGLRRGRIDMLLIANTFAAAGMVTVAIDAPLHGDRSFCTSGTTGPVGGCNPNVACVTSLPAGAQGDVAPPGACADGKLAKKRLDGSDVAAADQDGIPVLSANYFVSANLFRTRDASRQDIIDESQLVHVLAPLPGQPDSAVRTHMAGKNVVIDPSKVFFTGQSLGAIQGTMDVAANPRISKAVFNVGGGTIVDVFTNSPGFAAGIDQLLKGLGIDRVNDPEAFLQFVTVAKTALDPADPVNYAGHLTKDTLPNFLGTGAQPAKAILTQVAYCDGVVPNPFNFLHASNAGTSPLPSDQGFFLGGTGTFQLFTNAGFNPLNFPKCSPANGNVGHAFLLDPTAGPTKKAQDSIVNFIAGTPVPSVP